MNSKFDVQLAKIERDRQIAHDGMVMLRDLTKSIPLQLVLAFALIEGLQAVRIGENQTPIFGSVAGSMLEGGLVAGGFVEALAKYGVLEAAINQGGELAGKASDTLSKAAPLLLAAGAMA